jgi:hypothetical protein
MPTEPDTVFPEKFQSVPDDPLAAELVGMGRVPWARTLGSDLPDGAGTSEKTWRSEIFM